MLVAVGRLVAADVSIVAPPVDGRGHNRHVSGDQPPHGDEHRDMTPKRNAAPGRGVIIVSGYRGVMTVCARTPQDCDCLCADTAASGDHCAWTPHLGAQCEVAVHNDLASAIERAVGW